MSTLYRAGFTLSLLALSLAAQAQSPAPDDPSYINEVQSLPNVQKPVKGQAGAKGFFEDDTLTLTTRNFAARGDRARPFRFHLSQERLPSLHSYS